MVSHVQRQTKMECGNIMSKFRRGSHGWPVVTTIPKCDTAVGPLLSLSPFTGGVKEGLFEQPHWPSLTLTIIRSDHGKFLCAPHKAVTQTTGNRMARTSSSLVVSRTRFCTTCWVALAPTRPPRPGPCTGNSGLRLFRGSCLSLSRFRLLGSPDVNSPSRVTPGTMIAGAATASDMSSTVGRLAGPLLSNNLAPLRDV
jgi:hypothetical protein